MKTEYTKSFRKGECAESSVRSEVENCEEITSPHEEDSEDEQVVSLEDSNVQSSSIGDQDIRKYHCIGYRVPNLRLRRPEAKKIAEDYPCGDIFYEGDIEVDMTLIRFRSVNHKARVAFQKRLAHYCRRRSYKWYIYNRLPWKGIDDACKFLCRSKPVEWDQPIHQV